MRTATADTRYRNASGLAFLTDRRMLADIESRELRGDATAEIELMYRDHWGFAPALDGALAAVSLRWISNSFWASSF
jgi:hypothetical protein